MVRWNALLFACALLAAPVAPVAFAQQRQPAPAPQRQQAEDTTTNQAVLPAAAAWTPTGVEVRAGAALQISAQGRWSAIGATQSVAAARRDTSTDANGYPDAPAGRGAPLPEANRGALIGRIGENGAPFLIGAAYRGRASGDGMLFVTMNEPAEALQDNQGRMAIAITTTPPRRPEIAQEQPQTTPTPADPPRPVDPTTGAPTQTPNDPPAPADPPTAQTPSDDTAPAPQSESTPAPAPTPTPEIVDPPPPVMSDAVRYTLIGLGVLAGLLIVSLLIRPRGARGGERGEQGAGAQVSARIVSDGIAGQSLTIRSGGRS